jgi:hypothetical protein
MRLFTDIVESVEYITESTNNTKNHYITGIFAQADKPNRNGRTYPKRFMESALDKFQTRIDNKTATGELGHPSSSQINLDKISHLIESLEWHGNDVIGKAKILSTPMGNIAKNLLEGGVKLGVSTRGLGSLKSLSNGINEVQSDFILNTVDIVSDPSAPDAWVNGIMEGVEYFMTDDGRLQEMAIQEIKKTVQLSEEKKLQLFQNFIKSVLNHRT